MKRQVVIIGGGSAGTSCAFELRKHDKEIRIILIDAGGDLEYSPCALPYVISGEISSFKDIFLFRKDDYSDIELMQHAVVKSIDRKKRKVHFSSGQPLSYDSLVIATGSVPFIPKIVGLGKSGYLTLKDLEDARKIKRSIRKGSSSVIIGAGIIGLELAIALQKKGENVSLIEAKDQVLPALLDSDMAALVEENLANQGIAVHRSAIIKEVTGKAVHLEKKKVGFDKLFICTGVRPNISLAESCGIKTADGIVVDRYLKTSDKRIYACGDCAESVEQTTGRKILSQLGTTAVRQARSVAQNITGGRKKFPLVINTTISKMGGQYVGCAGLGAERASACGIRTVVGKYSGTVLSHYYSDKERITIKVISDEKGLVIGAQIVGDREVVGRLDLLALAIQKNMHVTDLASLETCYNPPSAPIFDPVTIAASICQKKVDLIRRRR